MRIQISPAEYDSHQMTDDHVAEAVGAIEKDGFVVLGGVIGQDALDAIKPKLEEDTAELLRRGNWGGAGRVPGHLQQSMPRSAKYIHRDIVTNPLVIQVTAAVLGEGVHNHFYNGNTNMPGSQTQPLHRDSGHLWPDIVHPFASVIDTPLPEPAEAEHMMLGSKANWTRVDARGDERRHAEYPPQSLEEWHRARGLLDGC